LKIEISTIECLVQDQKLLQGNVESSK